MDLRTWLFHEWRTGADFARQIGVSKMTVSRYIRGERNPSPETLARIEEATKGAVTAADFQRRAA